MITHGFAPGVQAWVSLQKSINLTHHTVISINVGKVFDKIQYLFTIKALNIKSGSIFPRPTSYGMEKN